MQEVVVGLGNVWSFNDGTEIKNRKNHPSPIPDTLNKRPFPASICCCRCADTGILAGQDATTVSVSNCTSNAACKPMAAAVGCTSSLPLAVQDPGEP